MEQLERAPFSAPEEPPPGARSSADQGLLLALSAFLVGTLAWQGWLEPVRLAWVWLAQAAGPSLFWSLWIGLLLVQTWRAAWGSFQALSREGEAIPGGRLAGLACQTPGGRLGRAARGWSPRLAELALAAPLLLASAGANGLGWLSVVGFSLTLAGMIVASGYLGAAVALSSASASPVRRLVGCYLLLLGGLGLLAAQACVDLLAGPWRYETPRQEILRCLLSLYLPLGAWIAVGSLRSLLVEPSTPTPTS